MTEVYACRHESHIPCFRVASGYLLRGLRLAAQDTPHLARLECVCASWLD